MVVKCFKNPYWTFYLMAPSCTWILTLDLRNSGRGFYQHASSAGQSSMDLIF
jgi:hypothetical protein